MSLERLIARMRPVPGLLEHALGTVKWLDVLLPHVPRSGGLPKTDFLVAALLHDFGKTTWPPGLHTEYPLDAADWPAVRTHPLVGERLVREDWPECPAEVLRLIRLHHARPGGKGYPLEEPDMPVLVLAAADVLDAVTRDRPYRPALPADAALAEIAGWGVPWLTSAAGRACVLLRPAGGTGA